MQYIQVNNLEIYNKCKSNRMISCSFKWISGNWEPCSKTCGSYGVQYREIYCIPHTSIYLNNTKIDEPWKIMASPNKCVGIAPANQKSCNRIPCHSYWEHGAWSQVRYLIWFWFL